MTDLDAAARLAATTAAAKLMYSWQEAAGESRWALEGATVRGLFMAKAEALLRAASAAAQAVYEPASQS